MRLTFKKNNEQTKKPVNRFLQDDASANYKLTALKQNNQGRRGNFRIELKIVFLTQHLQETK